MRQATYLRAVRELLAEPERWTKKAIARDAAGKATDVYDERAVSRCLGGARLEAERDCRPYDPLRLMRISDEDRALHQSVRKRGFEGFVSFNDAPQTTHSDILAVLDEAIAAYEREEVTA
jgi:hypothetical protein